MINHANKFVQMLHIIAAKTNLSAYVTCKTLSLRLCEQRCQNTLYIICSLPLAKICYGKYICAQSQKYFHVDVPMVLIRSKHI